MTNFQPKSRFLAYLVVMIAPVLLLAPLILRGEVLYWGTASLQFVAWWQAAWAGLLQGSLPLWNPGSGMGAPLLANYQSAFFYPPNWVMLPLAGLFGAVGIAWGYTLLTVLHLAWAGLGMAVLLKRLGFAWLGQMIGGLAFGLSGYLVGRLAFFSMLWAAAWLPWVIFCAEGLVHPTQAVRMQGHVRRFRLLPGLVACLALQLLAGHAQLTWYALVLAGAWVTFRGWQDARAHALRFLAGLKRVVWIWLAFAVNAALAAGIAAVQLLPTWEYLQVSQRADAVAYADAMVYSFWPWRLLTLFAPDFFGSPARGDFWGYASYWEDHLYPGMLALLLALASLWLVWQAIRRGRRNLHSGLTLFLWGGFVITFLLAFGKYTPVFPFLYRHIPTFAMFQAPARYLIWAAFAIPILAAVGAEHWRCPTSTKGRSWLLRCTVGAFAVMVGAGLAWLLLPDVRVTFISATALAGFWAFGFGGLTLLMPLAQRNDRLRGWQAAVLVWALVDLLSAGWGLNPGVPASFYAGVSRGAERVEAAAGTQRVFINSMEEYDLKFRRFLRFADFRANEPMRAMRDTLLPNLNLLDGVASANNFDPLLSERYTRWMAEINTLSPQQQTPWLALMGVGAVEHIDGRAEDGVRFDAVPHAQRWRWFSCAVAAPDDSDVAFRILAQRFAANANREAWKPPVVEGLPAFAVGTCDGITASQPQTGPGDAQVVLVADATDALTVSVAAQQAGWLMIADSWDAGWHATLDGSETTVYPANGVFRGVYVPAGTHTLHMVYRPFGFSFGAMLSILSLLGCFIVYISQRLRRKPLALEQTAP